MKDSTKFPSPIYQETVLAPIFDAFKANFYEEMMAINYAHAIMLMDQGILSDAEAKQIIAGLEEIERELDLDGLNYTGESEDLFFFIEKQLIQKIGIDVAGKLHTGRSRNDINITLFKMKTKQHLRRLISRVLELKRTLLEMAKENQETIFIAYTHGQPAQPTTLGHYLGALIEILGRDINRVLRAYATADQCSMGAAAITTSGFPLNREQMAELLGFAKPQENSYGCIAAVDYLLEVYSAIKILFLNLGRFAQDLDFQTSFELGHLYVPNEFVQISSIMPQKRNPVAVEHIRIQASTVVGQCDTVINAMHNTPFADMNDAEDPIQVVGFDLFAKADRCLKLITGFVSGLQVDSAKVERHINESFVTITELADTLVRKEGIGFRAAHEVASLLVRSLLQKGQNLDQVEYQEFKGIFQEVADREPMLTQAEFVEALDPNYFVRVRNVLGGPAPQVLAQSLRNYEEEMRTQVLALGKLARQEEEAKEKLNQRITNVVKA